MEIKPFDTSAKELVWDDPATWLVGLDIGPPGPAEVIDSDITAISAAADKVIKVGGAEPYLVNLEFQSSHQTDLAETIWFRQAALFHRHRLPVLTVLLLLRRDANSPRLSGGFEIKMPDGWLTNRYNYRVVRVWEEDPEHYLAAGVNLVPLAPLAKVEEPGLPALIQRMAARINVEPRPRATKLWTATYLLMGLCYSEELVSSLLEGVQGMQEATTYQAILREGRNAGLIEGRNEGRNEGRVSEAQRLLLVQGEIRFGTADEAMRRDLAAIRDLDRLERISRRVLDGNVSDWKSLLATT